MTKSTAEATKTSTSMPSSAPKTTPKDAQIVLAILKDMAIVDYEPRVVHQMIEFTYRYVSNVLEDSQLFSSYAKKKSIDSDDIRLAIQLQVDKGFTGPPPRDLLLEIARTKNNQALPPIKSHNGPRLPADRYSLVASNYRQKSNKLKPQSSQITLPYRSSVSGTSLLNTGSNATVVKPIGLSVSTTRPSGQSLAIQMQSRVTNTNTVTLKPTDTQSPTVTTLKRKLDES